MVYCIVYWSWSSNILATWCEELTHWCWETLKEGGERNKRRWDGWMASPTQWTWVSVNSGSWWWTGKPGVLQSMGWQRVGHDWATELNLIFYYVNVTTTRNSSWHSWGSNSIHIQSMVVRSIFTQSLFLCFSLLILKLGVIIIVIYFYSRWPGLSWWLRW